MKTTSALPLHVQVVGVSQDQKPGGPHTAMVPTVFLPLRGNIFAGRFPIYLITDGIQNDVAA